MNKHEQAIVDLEEWVCTTGLALPQMAGAIVEIQGGGSFQDKYTTSSVVDLVSGDIELLTNDWVVFAKIWRWETEGRHDDVNYCRLAVALHKADTVRLLGEPGQWEKYLSAARLLLEVA